MTDRRALEGLRALVMEDEYFIADDLGAILKRHGADLVVLSGDAEGTMDRMRRDGLNFALLDINMRGSMTFAPADELARGNVPFVFVSGYGRHAIPPRFDGIPNLSKPYDDAQIVDGVRGLWTRLKPG